TLIIHLGSVANTGTGELLATGGGTLDLQNVTVTDGANAKVQVDINSALDLETAIIVGGSLVNGGTVVSTGNSKLDGVTTTNSNLLEVTNAGTLIIHLGSVANTGTGELLATGGGTLDLQNVTRTEGRRGGEQGRI